MNSTFTNGRLGVRGWFYSAIGAMAVLVMLFSVVGAVLLAQASQASNTLVDRIAPARTAMVDMEGALVDEETGVRGYLLTQDADFLQPYTQGEQEQAVDVRQIRTLLAGDTGALAELATLQQAVADWKSAYAKPFIDIAKAHGTVDEAQLTASKGSFDHLRGVFATAESGLDAERAAAEAHLTHLDRVRDWAFAGMLAVFLATVCLIAFLVQVAVLRPLTRLRAEAASVQEGNFDAPLSATGPRDIRELGQGLDAMRARLARALAATERQRAALHRQKEALDAQAAELRRSNGELEQFAYVASHDLQEPLRKVTSFCQLIEKRYGELLDERGKQYIDYAVDGAKRMQVLINDLLAFSRVGRLSDRHERVEVQAVLGGALDGLAYAIEESGAEIRVDGPLPAVTGDPLLIGMLWQNLIGNSVKFRAPGRPLEIDIGWQPDPERPGFARLSVGDNGIGIAPEFAEKVFVIFQRLHSRDSYTGTGIGLALCKKIVEYHGGRIWIDREREVGARFLLTLPTAPDLAAAPASTAVPDAAESAESAAETEADAARVTGAAREGSSL